MKALPHITQEYLASHLEVASTIYSEVYPESMRKGAEIDVEDNNARDLHQEFSTKLSEATGISIDRYDAKMLCLAIFLSDNPPARPSNAISIGNDHWMVLGVSSSAVDYPVLVSLWKGTEIEWHYDTHDTHTLAINLAEYAVAGCDTTIMSKLVSDTIECLAHVDSEYEHSVDLTNQVVPQWWLEDISSVTGIDIPELESKLSLS